MIVNECYESNLEYTVGTQGQSDYEHWALTKSINLLSSQDGYTDADIAEPYYMGYIPYEYVPDHAQISKIDTDENYVYFKQIQNENTNVPWFYLSSASSLSPSVQMGAVMNYNLDDGNGWVAGGYYASGYTTCRFVNDLNVSTVNQQMLTIIVEAWTSYEDTTIVNKFISPIRVTFNSMSDAIDFLNGELEVQFTLDGQAITTDFESIIMTHQYTDSTHPETTATMHYFISGFVMTALNDSYPPGASGNAVNSSIGTGYFLQSDEEGISWISGLFGYIAGGYVARGSDYSFKIPTTARDLKSGIITARNNTGAYFTYNQQCYLFGGFKGQIDKELLSDTGINVVNRVITGENFICYVSVADSTSFAGTASLFKIYSKQAILNYLYQVCNLASSATYGFGTTKYVPKFNTDDSPAWLLLNDDLSEIEDQLRPWQLGRVTDNEFTPTDIPPYGPPTPPSEGEESGDKIPNQFRFFGGATNFITQYALTVSQVAAFGQLLWTSWADSLGDPTEMWKNFKLLFTGTDTGSIDIASVLDFIVSLKIFPFNLLSGGTNTFVIENNIKIGTGAYPLAVSSVAKLLSTITYVDAGYLDVPKPFGTFQDYENMNVTIYLPYCGTVQLNPADVVGWRLRCKYAVDLQSGNCVAVVEKCTYGADDNTYYNVAVATGQIGAMIPISATNSGQLMAQRISDATSVMNLLGGNFLSNAFRGANSFSGASGSGLIATGTKAISGAMSDFIDFTSNASNLTTSILSRASIECPSLSGGVGLASFIEPASVFLQMRYGIYDPPDNYNRSVGKISTESGTLGSYSGFVICENVDVSSNSLTCHNDEKAAIKALLETGVYL